MLHKKTNGVGVHRGNGRAEKFLVQSKNILVLAANRNIFHVAKNVLEENGHKVTDDVDADFKIDLVLIDSFFKYSGMADFFDQQRPDTPVVLIAADEENLHKVGNEIYDLVRVESFEKDLLEKQISNWVFKPKSQRLFDEESIKFGSGLWVEIAQLV